MSGSETIHDPIAAALERLQEEIDVLRTAEVDLFEVLPPARRALVLLADAALNLRPAHPDQAAEIDAFLASPRAARIVELAEEPAPAGCEVCGCSGHLGFADGRRICRVCHVGAAKAASTSLCDRCAEHPCQFIKTFGGRVLERCNRFRAAGEEAHHAD